MIMLRKTHKNRLQKIDHALLGPVPGQQNLISLAKGKVTSYFCTLFRA